MICIQRVAGRSTQAWAAWDPCPPLRARPGGELLCTLQNPAPPRHGRAALLPPAVMICIRQAAGRPTREWDPSLLLRALPGGELLCPPGALPRLRRAALLPPAVSIRSWRAAGLSTHEWDPCRACPALQAQPRGELLCTPRASPRLRQAALSLPAILIRITGSILQTAGRSTQV